MKKKSGFTLVELLAVIAILAILIIIALPNVMGMFNTAKKNSFITECKNIYSAAQHAWVSDSVFSKTEQKYSKCETCTGKRLDLSGRDNIDYYVEYDRAGCIVNFFVTDGTYQYSHTGSCLQKTDITDAIEIADSTGPQVSVVNDSVDTVYPEPESSDYYLITGDANTSGGYLRTSIQKNAIEKITFVTSINGHSANGTDTFDLSSGSNGSVLAWATDNDNNGLYEFTIGANGQVYISSGAYLFYNLTNLKSIEGMKNLNISKTDTFHMMFYNCSKLTSIDLSSFNTSHITKMAYLFYGCSILTSIDLSNFDTSNVTDMSYMFYKCQNLTSLNLSNFNTSKVTNFMGMFNGCKGLTSLNLSNFDTSAATNMSQLFSDCTNLTSLNISSFNTSRVTSMSSMFYNCSSLTNLDVSHFNTSRVTNMSSMFKNCSGLTSLNVSNFDTSRVTNMSMMFYNLYRVTSLDVSHFITNKVTNMSEMFKDCANLTSLELGSFDTSKVTDMSFMFSGCSKLPSLNLSTFTNPLVTNINDMFSGCTQLASINFGNFNTSNVIYMNNVFYNCKALTSLNLSSFNTSNVQYTKHMFSGCNNLRTIIANDSFNISGVTSGNSLSMFYGCTKLVGGSGTTFNSSRTDKTYARIDGGTSNPGYFTRDES